jgi:hypothetical protein
VHAQSVNFLLKSFDAFKFWDYAMKLYTSLAHFKELPNFSYAFKVRSLEQKIWAKSIIANPKQYIEGMDMLFDIDAKDFKEGHEQTKTLFEILRSFDVPFYVMPSGGKIGGFHIRIRWENLQATGFSWEEMPKLNYLICKTLKEKHGVKDLDLSLFDLRRVAKIPYGLTYGENQHWNVSLPLTIEAFYTFKPENVFVENVWRDCKIKFRGLCEIGSKPENVKSFIKEFSANGIEGENNG